MALQEKLEVKSGGSTTKNEDRYTLESLRTVDVVGWHTRDEQLLPGSHETEPLGTLQ